MVNKASLTTPIQPSAGKTKLDLSNRPDKSNRSDGGFAATLARETEHQESLKISSHAQKRLNSSQISLTDLDMQRIGGAVEKAGEKGSRQSLIMLDDLALVVSVKNKVVITAVDEVRRQEGVFTNIDSVVIA